MSAPDCTFTPTFYLVATGPDLELVEFHAGRQHRERWFYHRDSKRDVDMRVYEDDVLIYSLARTEGGEPVLTLRSDAETANGSTVTVAEGGFAGDLLLDSRDTSSLSGDYWQEFTLLVADDDGKPHCIGKGVARFRPSQPQV